MKPNGSTISYRFALFSLSLFPLFQNNKEGRYHRSVVRGAGTTPREEEHSARFLGPVPVFVKVGTGTCPVIQPTNNYGCDQDHFAVCFFKDDTTDEYKTKCKTESELAGKSVGDEFSTDYYLAACGPCDCFEAIENTGKIDMTPSYKDNTSKSFTCAPSAAPSASPSDSCLACEGDPEFVFSAEIGTWSQHKYLARAMGCELASIKNDAEQTAAVAALKPFKLNANNPFNFAFLGGVLVSTVSVPPTAYTYSWVDGSGTVTVVVGTTPNFFTGNPNGAALGATTGTEPYLGINLNGEWVDLLDGYVFPALYKCCSTNSQFDLAGCTVPAPAPSRRY